MKLEIAINQHPQIPFLIYLNNVHPIHLITISWIKLAYILYSILHLEMLKGDCHIADHSMQALISSCREDIGLVRLLLEYIIVSSANKRTLFLNNDGRSLMKIAKKRGPNTDP